MGQLQSAVPGILEHGDGQIDQPVARLKALEDILEAAFQLGACNRLTLLRAATRHAAVVGIVLVLALRPSARHVVPALATGDEATQREILTEISARSSARTFLQVPLNLLIGGEADQRLMMAAPQRHTPLLGLHIPRINWVLENLGDLPRPDLAVRQVFREVRLALKKALNLCLRPEAPVRISGQGLAQIVGNRLIRRE
ncbi:hypothetical protein A3734_07515 [Sulfitobacter sp. HI0054]|nr:hypothetical protein A3734_07515 [Sulfitobacter sp. HI0054]